MSKHHDVTDAFDLTRELYPDSSFADVSAKYPDLNSKLSKRIFDAVHANIKLAMHLPLPVSRRKR